ncbi:MAG: glycosyltransferase family 2 protein [Planctomycetota bacterium]
MTVLAWAMLVLAVLPAVMIAMNLLLYQPARTLRDGELAQCSPVSVLIPARDEAQTIEDGLRAALAGVEGLDAEVVVLDDHSTDGTPDLVRALANDDPRIRLEQAPPLPSGWNGKQHACWVLAQRAKHPTLLWVDADVRLQPGSVARMERYLRENKSEAKLISGVPRQITGTWLEVLIVPQILWVLLGYLPMIRMRASTMPGFGAGCGQLFMADREAYLASGGHEAISNSVHDGVDLPRTFRKAGFMTDLFDATDAAVCRMYTNTGDTWKGFTKNATAGMGSRKAILPWTILLLGAQVVPWVWLVASGAQGWMPWTAVGCAVLSSVLVALAFRQGVLAVVTRPLGILTLLSVQWAAQWQESRGVRPTWRGRVTT